MKNFVLFTMLLASLNCFAQSKITYTHDASGGRVLREGIVTAQMNREEIDEFLGEGEVTDSIVSLSETDSTSFSSTETSSTSTTKVFPNPTEGIVNVHFEKQQEHSYSLFGPTGSLVSSGKFISITNTIDLSSLSSGNYVLKLASLEGGVEYWKIIKQK